MMEMVADMIASTDLLRVQLYDSVSLSRLTRPIIQAFFHPIRKYRHEDAHNGSVERRNAAFYGRISGRIANVLSGSSHHRKGGQASASTS